ncbi:MULTISPECIES: N-acetylmuramoyl-L-alanine amidase [unclassified Gordonia (in: high G+C Gram-positive bacteria)]|uniref:N-acetylmuramoyl-L-alanine amidase n=1 Tax=unclassified Gordonia (in: high G+C Gram-positive bacteria) TaxID=2657482 RepID=UPI001FFE593A|nr:MULTISPECIES: N-acetylmuramoyl-L-alanine amidase [unclassified Gordonia (in: high G+C Gram-positive bacteria)]UQE75066.1 N-acetylmuramoyl-L-alanine amidase [Gordonia sp. PP30]
MATLRPGDHGSGVAEIREILAGLGLLARPAAEAGTGRHARPSEDFDDACERAVRAFQQQRGLIADGIVGPSTYAALREASYRLGSRVLTYRLSAPMTGDDVATLQSRLQNLGFYHGLVDGTFGETTHHAVSLYQTEYGLASDGICGPATLQSLNRLGSRVTGGSPHAIREEEHVRQSGPQLTGKRILIDPCDVDGSEAESEILWDLAARLEGRMSAAGMTTFLSHDRTSAPSDEQRARVANVIDADLMIALRLGHYDNERANGVATFYFGTHHGSYSTIGRHLAGYIQREVVARTPLLDCRIHERTWNLLRLTRMPAVVLEAGYITNPADAALLNAPEYRDTIAEAILVAVKRLYLQGNNDRPTGTYTFADLLAAEQLPY